MQYDDQTIRDMNNNTILSNCTGKKKALLIGINYFGQQAELKGCINDVNNIRRFIVENYGFSESNMWILTDDQQVERNMPTRQNIMDAMRWLVKNASKDDSLFFHFSGHGSQAEDKDGDEDDGFDETIVPLDYKQNGQIIDDDINKIMVKSLPNGARLTAIFDCCHSGSVMDLPYIYDSKGNLKSFRPEKVVLMSAVDIGKKYIMGNKLEAIKALKEGFDRLTKANNANNITKQTRNSLADVIMFSGCKDSQTSADANIDNKSTGAMSYALIKALQNNSTQLTFLELLNNMRDTLKTKYSQKPQLSSGREMNMNQRFIM